MNGRAIGWGLAFLAAGVVILGAWLPGSADWSTGPRIGMGTLLVVLGFVFVSGSFAAAIRRRTEATDSKGGCPVGATCSCGHFNFKPRKACRQCGAATLYTA
ncbi:MAG: hypothetical protein ACYC2H_08705 [Thermoplasmatota archaeon]